MGCHRWLPESLYLSDVFLVKLWTTALVRELAYIEVEGILTFTK